MSLHPIHTAATNGRAQVLDYLLARKCAQQLINLQTANSGYTPLHLAVIGGHVQCVKVLLKYGADLSKTDRGGKTAIQRAKKAVEITRTIVSEGKCLYCVPYSNLVTFDYR